MPSANKGAASVTLEEFGKTLDEVQPGKYAVIRYDLYADLFPPGEPDEGARAFCLAFARQHGCRIENKLDKGEIWFVKDA
jgi:hypothetical protein